ncbi:hypothetical protein DFH27DRAFT_574870 [Peziza echinospora]|nr:hypothetical protein DFH27DRAFT_574870 [Peziza echinospora]
MVTVTDKPISWLSKETPGYSLFADPPKQLPFPKYVLSSTTPEDGHVATPQRRIATRGTEIFLASGPEVRCADLRDLKARHEDGKGKSVARTESGADKGYKILNIPELDFNIHQLEISPDGNYLAIIGERQVGICMLPAPGFARLGTEKLRANYHHVGRAFYAENSERIVRALWHPLGVDGASLVILTSDAYIRVFDFTMHLAHTIEQPNQTFDLSALSGRDRQKSSFTPDPESFEPSSFCFGTGEQGWRPFTLYILMRGGDIYALSPIVPSRWKASADYLNNLALEISTNLEALTDVADATMNDKLVLRQQTKWVNEVMEQQATISASNQISFNNGGRKQQDWYTRPESVGPTPVLQGPFLLNPAPEETSSEEVYACDIMHITSEPVAILATVWSSGNVDVCLEFESVAAKWVGKKQRHRQMEKESHQMPVIACFETVLLNIPLPPDPARQSWPVFSENPLVAETIFVAHHGGVDAVDMSEWLRVLKVVLDQEEDENFIGKLLERSQGSAVTKVVNSGTNLPALPHPIIGCAVLQDSYVGYVLIATSPTMVYYADFDLPLESQEQEETLQEQTGTMQLEVRRTQAQNLPGYVASIVQPLYDPFQFLSDPPNLAHFLNQQRQTKPQLMRNQICYNAESLEILRQAREQVKREYERLMTTAEALCTRAQLQSVEYKRQVGKVDELNARAQKVQNADLAGRLQKSLQVQKDLTGRADALIRKLVVHGLGIGGEAGSVELSEREQEWITEVKKVKQKVSSSQGGLVKRMRRVEGVMNELGPLVERNLTIGDTEGEEVRDAVPVGIREKKLKELKDLYQKQAQLLDSTKAKVEKLESSCEELRL